MDSSVFFPVRDEGIAIEPARAVCVSCSVRRVCAAHAVLQGELYGIWGGLSAQDRRAIRSLMQLGERTRWVPMAMRERAESAVLDAFGYAGLPIIKAPNYPQRKNTLIALYLIEVSTSVPPWTSR
jgi:WhiB family redox-sensing transcriptional regulator